MDRSGQPAIQPAENSPEQKVEAGAARCPATGLDAGGSVTWAEADQRNGLGVPMDLNFSRADATKTLLKVIGEQGMKRIGRMEFGLMAQAGAPWLLGHEELLQ